MRSVAAPSAATGSRDVGSMRGEDTPAVPMKVLVLSPDPGIPLYGPSGSSAHLRGVISAFAARGDEVRVAVAKEGGPAEDAVPAEVVSFAPRRWGWLPRVWRERGETWDARRLLAAGLDGFA